MSTIIPSTPASESLVQPYQPYLLLPGSDGVVDGEEKVWSDAATVFPVYDGVTNTLCDTVDFDTATVEDFIRWHSAHQVEYFTDGSRGSSITVPADNGTERPTGGVDRSSFTARYVDFGASGNNEIFLLSQDGDRVIRLNSLTYTEIARLSIADQRALASLSEFRETVGSEMDLLPDTTATQATAVTDARQTMIDQADTFIDAIKADINAIEAEIGQTIIGSTEVEQQLTRDAFLSDASVRGDYWPYFFIEQIELYKAKFENMALFNQDRILTELNEIKDRFDRFVQYYSFPSEGTNTTGLKENINASDSGTTVSAGLSVFLRVESSLFELGLEKAYIATTGTFLTHSEIIQKAYDTDTATFLDLTTFLSNTSQGIETNTDPTVQATTGAVLSGPNMLFLVQNHRSQELEAEAEAKSEELNQSNKLLEDYGLMQNMINDTLNVFSSDGSSTDETHALLGETDVNNLNTDDHPLGYTIASMFDTSANADNAGHPVEVGKSITRPTASLGTTTSDTLTAQSRTYWDSFASTLGDMTKNISQDSEIRLDEVSTLNKSKNRAFDLGSNTLSKLTDILRNITS